MSEEVWDTQIDTNFRSVYLFCYLVLLIMEKQETGDCVVNISSVAGLRYTGKPQVAYAVTKAALIHAKKKTRQDTVMSRLINTPLIKMLADKYAGGD